MTKILVTTDFSLPARSAYPTAALIARDFRGSLTLAHYAQQSPVHYLQHCGSPLPSEAYFEALAKKLVEEARHPSFNGCEVLTRLLRGGQGPELVARFALEEAFNLVVLATHGRSGLPHAILGSFAERLVRISEVPVYTCHRERDAFPPLKVVVPFDFSENSSAVLATVRKLSKHYQPSFQFVYVIHEPRQLVFDLYPASVSFESLQEAEQRAIEKAREEFEKLVEECPGLDASLTTCQGRPEVEIRRVAEEFRADLILMATHGWTGMKHALLGSVAEKVVRRAPCAVWTIRPEAFGRVPEDLPLSSEAFVG